MISIELLGAVPLFSGLSSEELAAVAKISLEQNYRKGAVVITEGEKTDSLYAVLSGKAVVVSIDDEGRQIVLNEFGPGDHFGEMSFIDGAPRCADVEIRAPTRLLAIPRNRFREIVAGNPDICFNLMKGLNDKLRNATEQVKDLVFRDVYGRVARFFDKVGREEGGRRVIDERLTHQDIADRVGASREMISRIFTELRKGGYIEVQKKRIAILRELPYRW
jgi:CRP/FNR family transcriptional regulator, cyclic AMP receptor protein